jgi:hypothetical protein
MIYIQLHGFLKVNMSSFMPQSIKFNFVTLGKAATTKNLLLLSIKRVMHTFLISNSTLFKNGDLLHKLLNKFSYLTSDHLIKSYIKSNQLICQMNMSQINKFNSLRVKNFLKKLIILNRITIK